MIRGGELLLLKMLDQQSQRLRYHLPHVATGNLVPEEILGAPQQVVCFLRGRELNLVTLGRQGDYDRPRRGSNNKRRGSLRGGWIGAGRSLRSLGAIHLGAVQVRRTQGWRRESGVGALSKQQELAVDGAR